MQERMAPTRGRGTPYWLGYQRLRLDSSESRRHQQREARLWQLRRTEELSRSCACPPPPSPPFPVTGARPTHARHLPGHGRAENHGDQSGKLARKIEA